MMETAVFSEKLNKVEGKVYVIEEEVTMPANGVYEAPLRHDNANEVTLTVYTGPRLTGEQIQTYVLSTPSLTPWKKVIRIQASVPAVYICYETDGDTVEAEDVNRLQEELVRTQEGINREEERAKEKEEAIAETVREHKEDADLAFLEHEKKFVQMEKELDEKVEKIDGKQLSSNDYTDEEKRAVADSAKKSHTHDNKEALDDITEEDVGRWRASLQRRLNGMLLDGTADRANYGVCTTEAGEAVKSVECAGFSLMEGAEIVVKFAVGNTAEHPSLNVNGTGSRPMYYRGAAVGAECLGAGRIYAFRYNGQQYDFVGDMDLNDGFTHPDSGVTAGTYRCVTVDSMGHVIKGSNPTTLSGYGITDAAAKTHNHDSAYLKKGAVTWADLGGG